MAKVQINYKSGLTMRVECEEFSVARGPLSLEWRDARPRPWLIGVDDIESIWEI